MARSVLLGSQIRLDPQAYLRERGALLEAALDPAAGQLHAHGGCTCAQRRLGSQQLLQTRRLARGVRLGRFAHTRLPCSFLLLGAARRLHRRGLRGRPLLPRGLLGQLALALFLPPPLLLEALTLVLEALAHVAHELLNVDDAHCWNRKLAQPAAQLAHEHFNLVDLVGFVSFVTHWDPDDIARREARVDSPQAALERHPRIEPVRRTAQPLATHRTQADAGGARHVGGRHLKEASWRRVERLEHPIGHLDDLLRRRELEHTHELRAPLGAFAKAQPQHQRIRQPLRTWRWE